MTEENIKRIVVVSENHKVFIDAMNYKESEFEAIEEESGEKFIVHFKLKQKNFTEETEQDTQAE